MNDTDTQVRAALTELAAEVPASRHAWEEHERRMAARTRARRGWTIGAAAASVLVIAAVVTPIVLTRGAQTPITPAVTDEAQPPRPGSKIGPVKVLDYINGGYRTMWVSVDRGRTDEVCERETVHASVGGEEIQRDDRGCTSTPIGDNGPARIHPLPTGLCQTDDPSSIVDCAMVTGVVVIATAPEVDELDVAAVGGKPVTARELGRTDELALFVADFMSTPLSNEIDQQRFTYTARDADGGVIDEVTRSGR